MGIFNLILKYFPIFEKASRVFYGISCAKFGKLMSPLEIIEFLMGYVNLRDTT